MTDEELATFDKSILDDKSKNELARERQKREYANNQADKQDDTNWKMIVALIAILGVIVTALTLI